ncbi:MAG: hypothetical protein LBQ22_11215 [Bacteroidales bacterium]|jgi:ABC-type antimicrobial peptide transport system ATPase subunit|nr:hypothetical protein [Bacteroidales bacterium]
MDKSRKTKIEKFISLFKRNIKNRNIFVFLFFLLLSAFLWFLNALNKEYTTTVTVTLKIENIPGNLIVKDKEAGELRIDIYGHGYSLLKAKIDRIRLPLLIDFNNKTNNVTLYKGLKDENISYLLTGELYSTISRRFGDNIQIISILPDTIYFYPEEKMDSKKVPVTLAVEYNIHPEYLLVNSPVLSEDSIVISGQQEIIDTIKKVFTSKQNIGIIDENNKKTVEIEMLPGIQYSTENITVEFPVEKYTETYKEVQIQPLYFPDNTNIVLSPANVQVYYKVPLSLYNNIENDNFEVSVNYNKRKNDIIPVDIKSRNQIIEITKITPIFVKYLLEKNNTDD